MRNTANFFESTSLNSSSVSSTRVYSPNSLNPFKVFPNSNSSANFITLSSSKLGARHFKFYFKVPVKKKFSFIITPIRAWIPASPHKYFAMNTDR
jgi:hypothetical protein